MRITMLFTGAALVLSGTALAQTALAQDDSYGTETYGDDGYQAEVPASTMTVDDTFAVIDTDADGTVTETEFVAYAGEGSETQFASMAGDDATLTLDELQSFMEQPAATE